jgi:hypothetical protein
MLNSTNASTYGITNLLIHHNKFYGLWPYGATAAIYLSGNFGYQNINGAWIYDNVIAFDTTANQVWSPGAIDVAGSDEGVQNNINIYNNTIAIDGYPGGNNIIIGTASNVTIKNNIITGGQYGVAISPSAGSGIAIDYNLYYNNSGSLIWDRRASVNTDCTTIAGCQASPMLQEAHGHVGNPQYTTAPNGTFGHGNWNIQSNSAAINVGLDLSGSFTTDFLGTTRPTGANTWDIGAYEYGAGGGSTGSSLSGGRGAGARW